MKHVIVFLIRVYQMVLSPLLHMLLGVRYGCRYSVSCSEYTKQQVMRYGVIDGLHLGLVRFLSCQPFGTIAKQ